MTATRRPCEAREASSHRLHLTAASRQRNWPGEGPFSPFVFEFVRALAAGTEPPLGGAENPPPLRPGDGAGGDDQDDGVDHVLMQHEQLRQKRADADAGQ